MKTGLQQPTHTHFTEVQPHYPITVTRYHTTLFIVYEFSCRNTDHLYLTSRDHFQNCMLRFWYKKLYCTLVGRLVCK